MAIFELVKIFGLLSFAGLLFPASAFADEPDPHWHFLRTLRNGAPAGIACTYTSDKIKPPGEEGACPFPYCGKEFLVLRPDDLEYGETGKMKEIAILNVDNQQIHLREVDSSKGRKVFKDDQTTLTIRRLKTLDEVDGTSLVRVKIRHRGKVLEIQAEGECSA